MAFLIKSGQRRAVSLNQRAIPPKEEKDATPVDQQRLVATASLGVLAVLAVGAALFVMRELLIPVVTAFVVGVMLSPIVKALEARKIPRIVGAALIVLATALLVALLAALIAAPLAEIAAKLPEIGAKLHTFDGMLGFLHRVQTSLGMDASGASAALPAPSVSWLPTTFNYVSPPVTGFLYFLIVLMLFLSWWPDLRRELVMTFASRDSRLTVLKILNEMEASLASYLVIVACINLAVGAAAATIAALTRLPFPVGWGALAATLNFIPIVGPIAMIVVLAVVGVVTGPSTALLRIDSY
jgi:predicted PurR-regulated permease PerM